MATDLVIRILSKDKTKAGLKKTKKNLDSILTSVGAITGAVVAFGLAAKKAFELGEEGAQLDLTEKKFDRLAKTIGVTGDVLSRDLQKAMGGIVSQTEALALGTDLLSLGLVKSTEEATRMAAVVGQLGMDMNQLVLTLTNQTTMRFDALGVSVDGFKGKVKELEDAGHDTNEAFRLAFLAQAEKQVKKVGDVAETSAGEFMQMRAAWKDWMDDVKQGIAEVLVPSISVANDRRDAFNAVEEAVAAKMITEEESWSLNARIANSETDLIRLTEELTSGLESYREEIVAINPLIQRQVELLQAQARAEGMVGEAAKNTIADLKAFTTESLGLAEIESLFQQFTGEESLGGKIITEDEKNLLASTADIFGIDLPEGLDNYIESGGVAVTATDNITAAFWREEAAILAVTRAFEGMPKGTGGGGGGPEKKRSGKRGGEERAKGFAAGGLLSSLALVGERGPEMIINGVVIPAGMTKELMRLGLFPGETFGTGGAIGAFEGDIIGGGRRVAPKAPSRRTGAAGRIGGGGRGAASVSMGGGGVTAASVMAGDIGGTAIQQAVAPMVASINIGNQAKTIRDNDLLAAVKELAKAEDMEQAVKNAADLTL